MKKQRRAAKVRPFQRKQKRRDAHGCERKVAHLRAQLDAWVADGSHPRPLGSHATQGGGMTGLLLYINRRSGVAHVRSQLPIDRRSAGSVPPPRAPRPRETSSPLLQMLGLRRM